MWQQLHTNIAQDALEANKEIRDRIDLLRCRAGLLTGKDKLLMEMYLERGNTFRQMARLAGSNEASIARKIYKLTQRLLDGEYITCLRNRDEFSKAELSIGRDYFLRGLSQRKLAKKHKLSIYRVRNTLKKIQQLVQVLEEPQK